jgi:hypothetical protein
VVKKRHETEESARSFLDFFCGWHNNFNLDFKKLTALHAGLRQNFSIESNENPCDFGLLIVVCCFAFRKLIYCCFSYLFTFRSLVIFQFSYRKK